jgi:hypothetical protein
MLSLTPSTDTGLLEDLLDASARLYHRNVAVIQRIFADQFFKALRDRQTADPAFREEQLLPYRQALKEKLLALVEEQQKLRRERDANACAFVGSRSSAA